MTTYATLSLQRNKESKELRTYKDISNFIVHIELTKSKGQLEVIEFTSNDVTELENRISFTVGRRAAGKSGEPPLKKVKVSGTTSDWSTNRSCMEALQETSSNQKLTEPVLLGTSETLNGPMIGSTQDTTGWVGKPIVSGYQEQLELEKVLGFLKTLRDSKETEDSTTTSSVPSTNGSTTMKTKRSSSLMTSEEMKEPSGDKLRHTLTSSIDGQRTWNTKEEADRGNLSTASSHLTSNQSHSWTDFTKMKKELNKQSLGESTGISRSKLPSTSTKTGADYSVTIPLKEMTTNCGEEEDPEELEKDEGEYDEYDYVMNQGPNVGNTVDDLDDYEPHSGKMVDDWPLDMYFEDSDDEWGEPEEGEESEPDEDWDA